MKDDALPIGEWAVENLPAELLSEFFKIYGGQAHYIPKLKNCRASRDARNARIRAAWLAAVPNAQIAREHGLHIRTVEVLVERLRKAAFPGDAA